MKITDIQTIFVDRYLFVQVHTDEGITGLGESGAWGYLEASAGAVETFKRYLIGQDPLRIEHHWQYLYRWTHFRGAAIMGALSAIDIALWDIAGKHFGVPTYQLLGGKTRDKARVYYHVFGDTKEKLIQGCIDAKAQGFTAVGHLTPFLDEDPAVPFFKTHADKMTDAIETVRALSRGRRQRSGPLHRDPSPSCPRRGDCAGARHRAVSPLLLRRPDPARQLRCDGAGGAEHPHPHRDRRAHPHHLRVRGAATPRRGAICAPRCLSGGRDHAQQEDRGAGGGASRGRRPAQPAQPGQHRGLHPTRRVHPQLCAPGISAGRA